MRIDELYGSVRIADTCVVGEHCVLGYPKEARLSQALRDRAGVSGGSPVVIGGRCILFNHVIAYEGVRIFDDCVIEDRVRIGYDSSIGPRTRVVYGAYLCDRVRVGADACVAGFVCDGATVGNRSTVMGELVHEYSQPHRGWWEVDEATPVIESDTVVGFGARVIGGVTIGPRSYVAAGATVTRDVPTGVVVTGTNVHTPTAEWSGARLQKLLGHWKDHPPDAPAR